MRNLHTSECNEIYYNINNVNTSCCSSSESVCKHNASNAYMSIYIYKSHHFYLPIFNNPLTSSQLCANISLFSSTPTHPCLPPLFSLPSRGPPPPQYEKVSATPPLLSTSLELCNTGEACIKLSVRKSLDAVRYFPGLVRSLQYTSQIRGSDAAKTKRGY